MKRKQTEWEDALTMLMVYVNAFTTACIVVSGSLLWVIKHA